MRSRNTAILLAGLCLGVLIAFSISKEQLELNGTNLNGVALNGAQGGEQSRSIVSGETTQFTTTATLNNMPVQAISLEGGQLVFHLDNPQ